MTSVYWNCYIQHSYVLNRICASSGRPPQWGSFPGALTSNQSAVKRPVTLSPWQVKVLHSLHKLKKSLCVVVPIIYCLWICMCNWLLYCLNYCILLSVSRWYIVSFCLSVIYIVLLSVCDVFYSLWYVASYC